MMGYEQLDSARLVLKKVSSPDHLLYVACECYVAAVECILMTRTLERVEVVNYILKDVYQCRQECCGDVDAAVLWITDNCTPSKASTHRQKDGLDKPDRDRLDKDGRRYSDIGYRLRERDHHWERYRDRLSPDPLYGLGFQNRNMSLGYSGYDSIGRPVRSNPGLSLQRKGTEDHGEISMEVPQNMHNGRYNRHSPNDNSPDNIYNDPGGAEDVADGGDGLSEVSALTLAESVSDYDLYEAGTIDDHLQRSLLYIQRMESGPKSLKDQPQVSTNPSDEWGDVREKLRLEYGDKYFEGDRGNILKERKPLNMAAVPDGASQAQQFKTIEPETMQQYNSVVQEMVGKIGMRRVPTPSPPSSGTPRRSPPTFQSPPLSHHSPPQYVSPPQSGRPSPPQTRAVQLVQPCSLDAKRRMPSIYENTVIPNASAMMEMDCPDGTFPPPPADLTPPDPRELTGAEFEGDDDTLPPPPESLDELNAVGSLVEKGEQNPLENLGLTGAQKEEEFDDARFDKPRFQSFGVEDGEFLLKRERGPSPPPRLLPRNGKPNGPYRPERIDRRSFYENVDSDSNASTSISSPMGTASTFSSSADTVIAAQERLTRQSPPSEKTVLKSDRLHGSSNSLLRNKGDAKESVFVNRKLGIKSQSYEEERLPSQVAVLQLNRPKSVGFAADDSSSTKWQCSTCTFKNIASDSVCDMCGRSRERGPEQDPLTSGGPQCPYCTLVNPEGTKQCEACEADLEGCATYI